MRLDLVLIGFVLMFMGIALLSLTSHVQYGGVVIVGPIPIVFGSSPEMIVFCLILALIIFSLLIFMRWW